MSNRLFRVRHFTFILIAIGMIVYGNHFVNFSKEGIKIYPKPDLKYFTFGYKNLVADSLWISFLQDSGYCEESSKASSYNAGKNLDEILDYKMAPSRCHKGWVFQTLNTLSDMDPKFYPAYSIGGTMLAVAVDDRYGAKEIFDKGLIHFPNDWTLNYRASYLYLQELQEPKRAAELLITAYKNGGPSFLPSLAARLYSKVGQALLGQAILKEFIENNPDYKQLDRVKERLKEVEKALQQ